MDQLNERMSDSGVEFNIVRAADRNFLIQGTEDFYGAVIHHISEHKDRPLQAMDIYLTLD